MKICFLCLGSSSNFVSFRNCNWSLMGKFGIPTAEHNLSTCSSYFSRQFFFTFVRLFFFNCILTCFLLILNSILSSPLTRYVYAALHFAFKWPLPSLISACLKVVSNICFTLLVSKLRPYNPLKEGVVNLL